MRKSSRNKNRKDYPNTPYGITPLNYYQVHLAPYQDDYYPSLKKKLLKRRDSSKNIYDEIRSGHHGVHTQPTFSLSKRKMASFDRYKIIDHSTNGQRKIEMYPHSSPLSSTGLQDAPFSPSSISDGGTTTFASNQEMSGKQPSSPQKGYSNRQSCSSD